MPDHLFDWPHDENEARRACECDACQDDEGPVKLSGPIENESGECRGDDTREIADEVLEPGPASGGLGPGERLGDGPDTGVSNAEKTNTEYERGDGVGRSANRSEPNENAGECEAAPDNTFANYGRRGSQCDAPIRKPTG